jgi:hypothetical protein
MKNAYYESDPDILFHLPIQGHEIIFKATDYGKLRIGGYIEWSGHYMQSFPINYINGDIWFNLKGRHYSQIFMLHVNFTPKAIWCNAGPELSIDDNEFPFLLISPIRRLAIQKQIQERNEYPH